MPWSLAPTAEPTGIALSTRCADLRPQEHTEATAASASTSQLLACRIRHPGQEIRIADAVKPDPSEEYGVGPDGTATLLIAPGDNPDRLRSEASFAALCGVSPIKAPSGKNRRLNRGGDRRANAALFRIIVNAHAASADGAVLSAE